MKIQTECRRWGSSKRGIPAVILVVAMGFFLSTASASVTYQINNGGLAPFNLTIDGNAMNQVLAGGIQINKVAGDAAMPNSYVTLCTDIEATLYLGQSYTYNTPETGFNGLTGIKPTWGAGNNDGSAAKAIQNAAYLFYTYGQLTGTGIGGTTEQKAALQLAVWAALYNTTAAGDVTGSRFTMDGGNATAIAQASSWLSSLTGNYSYAGYILYPSQLTGVNRNGDPPQELLFGNGIQGMTPVPETTTVLAGALLLLPFAASTLRMFRKNRLG